MPVKVLILAGPTASGKTELLEGVFARGASFFSSRAREPGGRHAVATSANVISADSMQAYRGMDIGTAKPDASLTDRLPHHLIDIKNPDEQYTAGEFVHLADALCLSLSESGILPVVSGGTVFYLKNFICGTPSSPPSSPEIRAEVAGDLEARGSDALRAELEAADPASAARISGRDIYRLTRAVEILRASGRPPSEFAPSRERRPGYEFLILGVERPRGELRARIAERVKKMFREGLAEEVEALAASGYGPDCPGLKAIGYREFFTMRGAPPAEIAAAIELHTAQYAKRQMTFLRSLPGIRWIPPDSGALAAAAEEFLG